MITPTLARMNTTSRTSFTPVPSGCSDLPITQEANGQAPSFS